MKVEFSSFQKEDIFNFILSEIFGNVDNNELYWLQFACYNDKILTFEHIDKTTTYAISIGVESDDLSFTHEENLWDLLCISGIFFIDLNIYHNEVQERIINKILYKKY